MSRTLQFKRYPTSALQTITGSDGELIVDDTTHTATIHDGATPGGIRLATEALATNAYNQSVTATLFSEFAFNQANTVFAQANSAYAAANTAATQLPQNLQTTNYVLQISDSGKYIYYKNTSNVNLYIPNAGTTNFSNGNFIQVISKTTTGNITLVPNTGVSLFAAGNSVSGSHNVTSYGVVTLTMAEANTWFVSGTGLN